MVESAKNSKARFGVMETIPTTRGVVRCSDAHGANERAENIAIAKYFAEKYGYEIDLLPVAFNEVSADVYNKTLNIKQEYKTNRTPTKGAIDNVLRKASFQAKHIVLHVQSDIPNDQLRRGIKGRVKWAKSIQTVTILRGGQDKTYTRKEILHDDFEP